MAESNSQDRRKDGQLVLRLQDANEMIELLSPKESFTVALAYDPEYSTWKYVPKKVNGSKSGKDSFNHKVSLGAVKEEHMNTPTMFFRFEPSQALKSGEVHRLQFICITDIKDRKITRSLYFFVRFEQQ